MNGTASCSFSALGTTATAAVSEEKALPMAERMLRAELDAIDRACSRFRADSELHVLERSRGRPIEVSALLIEALTAALRAARLTNGLVSPTLGRSLRVAGYDRDFELIQPREEAAVFTPASDWRALEVDPRRRVARLAAGVELDLGATAKALAADRAAAAIAAACGCGALVNLGGDLRAAGPAPPRGWPIVIDDEHDVQTAAAVHVVLGEGGLATSSVARRRWRRGASDDHHILDPRTGAPAAGAWRTVSVAAASCLDANIASTASMVIGHAAPAWLAARRLPARLVHRDGSIAAVAGWPRDHSEASLGRAAPGARVVA